MNTLGLTLKKKENYPLPCLKENVNVISGKCH